MTRPIALRTCARRRPVLVSPIPRNTERFHRQSRARALVSGDLKTLEMARKLKEDRVDAVPVRSSPLAPAPISRASSRRRTTIGEEFDEWIASAERAASLEAERPPTEFMSVTTLVKVRAWIRKWRARAAAHRPAPERCLVDVVPGTHVAVSRNRETVERAMRDPSTVRCAHLAGADPEGYFDDTRGGRWERPAAVRTVRVGRAGTPPRGEIRALSRGVTIASRGDELPRLKKCRGCLVSLPKSAMGRAVGEDGAPVAPLCVFCAKMTGDSRSRRRVGPVRGGGPFALPAEDERDAQKPPRRDSTSSPRDCISRPTRINSRVSPGVPRRLFERASFWTTWTSPPSTRYSFEARATRGRVGVGPVVARERQHGTREKMGVDVGGEGHRAGTREVGTERRREGVGKWRGRDFIEIGDPPKIGLGGVPEAKLSPRSKRTPGAHWLTGSLAHSALETNARGAFGGPTNVGIDEICITWTMHVCACGVGAARRTTRGSYAR